MRNLAQSEGSTIMAFALLAGIVLSIVGAEGESIALDLEPASYQKPHTPADGATVSVNPPPFIWVPPKKDLTYIVEIARSADFSNGLKRVTDIPVSTVALREPLEPGVWHWRYGVVGGDGNITFSKARTFTVPENIPVWPYPDLEATMARIPQQHPRLFITSDKLAEYRKRAKDGDLAAIARSMVDSYLKKTGEPLVEEPPYVTGKGPERGKNYSEIFRATRPPMDLMQQCAMAYLLTGNEQLGAEAKRRILHFFSWDPAGSTAYKHNDEPAMWVMMRGVRAYDWTYDLFTPEERQRVEECMHIRAAQFYEHLRYRRRFHTNPHESHAGRTIGFLGEACIAFAHEWPEAHDWLDYVLTNYWNVYPAWGREDGGWHEGPGYYTAYMSFALHFVLPLREATGIDLMQKPFFQNTPHYLLYTNPPYAKTSAFGDGENGGSSRSKGNIMYYFSSLVQDPYVRWYADAWKTDGGNSILGVVLRDDSLVSKPLSDLPQARYFPGVGLVSLHTALGDAANDVHFLIHSDPYGAISHAHADQNAFTLEAFGEPLAICSGYYPWYGSNHHAKWQWESKSSNTITFDGGIGQKIRSSESKGVITAFAHNSDYDYVAADATAAYPDRLTQCVRHVVHVRPGVFVMLDEVKAPKPVTFEWRLHARSEMQLDQPKQTVVVLQGDARLHVQFFGMALNQTTGFEHPPERAGADQFHLVASTPEKADSAHILTLLTPYRAGDEAAVPEVTLVESPGALGLEYAASDGYHLVGFKTDASAATVQLGRCTTDADVFAVELDAAGKPKRTLLHGGEQLDISQ